MPVTARLSKSFYDRFGDQVANELVEWFNAVDTTYRTDLREINEMNFARFDAKLEERLAKFDVRFARIDAQFAQIEARFARIDEQFAQVEARFTAFERQMNERFAAFERRIDERFVAFEDRIARLLAERLSASESRMRNWMIGFCTTQLFALVGLMYTVLHGR